MRLYELACLISSEVSEGEAENVQEKLTSFLQEKEGFLIEKSKIFRKKLAYPIKKSVRSQAGGQASLSASKREQTQAYLACLVFQLKPELLKDFEEQLDQQAHILRYLIIAKNIKKPAKESRKPRIGLSPEREVLRETAGPLPTASQSQKKKVELKEIDKTIEEILSE